MLKRLVRAICPPVAWNALREIRRFVMFPKKQAQPSPAPVHSGDAQALGIYWDPAFAEVLETWGEGTVWLEVLYLMVNLNGRVLDIACGTGQTIKIVSRFDELEVHGCDISDVLISKAVDKGIPRSRLRVCDATNTGYPDGAFDYSYSIGSLEHFSDRGIDAFLRECRRVTNVRSFHQIPVSRSGSDEGWVRDSNQEFFNNCENWWLARFRMVFPRVRVLDSQWAGDMSLGRWFVCDSNE
jgi:SAM-dependent methyltransferase